MTFVEVVQKSDAQLGETPLWDVRTGRLTWIDIERPRLYSLDPETGRFDSVAQPGIYLGSQALTRSGRLVLARDLNLVTCAPDGSDVIHLAATPDEAMPATRLAANAVKHEGARNALACGSSYANARSGLCPTPRPCPKVKM